MQKAQVSHKCHTGKKHRWHTGTTQVSLECKKHTWCAKAILDSGAGGWTGCHWQFSYRCLWLV